MSDTRTPVPTGVILVIRTHDAREAVAAAEAAMAAGIDAVEITRTVPGTAEVIAELTGRGTPVGVGTVLDASDVAPAVRAGATFVVAPDTDALVVRAAREQGIAVIPGALTPTEVQRAHKLGADAVKLFPAGAAGGARYLTELRGPLPHIPFVISGGVTAETAPEYFAAGAVAVCVGIRMFDPVTLAERDHARLVIEATTFLDAARRRQRVG
ncbi:bifunctional 4-hydroxy-2-oxoglutarate aldolase/2-dehydro-3-deoxy-phosphogluconate aldolase [Leifsonia shinshuensis]|uniref:bifunctional 4-hydroxy-2-oxoglutarate aldolase/2-dehydro-3-deoxy-phosphogluconate aldolase n=1 Tax=Leifsonia shinshuensis TaxID=150026 RepID=UPI001F504DA0|nr:bifunctional 4-hydroxy-2-oxoglutarate aldolase/2-dehydro-3-deoxy-phosphogluconate aldolase [Leifsonia shinshuensis]MCI0158802.1 bifunctional 4-hydroxy-2-oxoglutarate aldolase/2-dehydro-3-deoxy-phosphogluconate aldolase [Leifsonia shinshuensis]